MLIWQSITLSRRLKCSTFIETGHCTKINKIIKGPSKKDVIENVRSSSSNQKAKQNNNNKKQNKTKTTKKNQKQTKKIILKTISFDCVNYSLDCLAK